MMSAITAKTPPLNQASVCRPYSTCMMVRSLVFLISNSPRSVCMGQVPVNKKRGGHSGCFSRIAVPCLAQRFFFNAAGAFAALQLGNHVVGTQPVVDQRNQAVKPQISHLADQLGLERVGGPAMVDVL